MAASTAIRSSIVPRVRASGTRAYAVPEDRADCTAEVSVVGGLMRNPLTGYGQLLERRIEGRVQNPSDHGVRPQEELHREVC